MSNCTEASLIAQRQIVFLFSLLQNRVGLTRCVRIAGSKSSGMGCARSRCGDHIGGRHWCRHKSDGDASGG
ncbi:hypothetical protein KCP69_26340 [Salmonella enterica subsp. enterica]|nr:hypothetical protein KCP69_26340 [Salmonella enterica subsp. enterica]